MFTLSLNQVQFLPFKIIIKLKAVEALAYASEFWQYWNGEILERLTWRRLFDMIGRDSASSLIDPRPWALNLKKNNKKIKKIIIYSLEWKMRATSEPGSLLE